MGFEMFTPEVNSTLMYAGPGPSSMASAAAAWDGLAADLYASAESYQSVVLGLAASWLGPASVAMMAAIAPFVTWLNTTAILAEQAGAVLKAAIAAFEAAYLATVPPGVVFANRALLALLIATNFFGQNFPAIAATEAHYMLMWAQDGLVMNTYAAAAAQLTSSISPFDTPSSATNPLAAAEGAIETVASSIGSSVTSMLSGLTTSFPAMLAQLSSASPLSGLSGLFSEAGLSAFLTSTVAGAVEGVLAPAGVASAISEGSVPAYFVSYVGLSGVKMLISLTRSLASATGSQTDMNLLVSQINDMVNAKLQPAVRGLAGQFVSMNRAVLASFGKANTIGRLSVPEGWNPVGAQTVSRAMPVLPATSVASPAVNAESSPMSNPFTQALMSSLSGRGVAEQGAPKGNIKGVTRVPAGG